MHITIIVQMLSYSPIFFRSVILVLQFITVDLSLKFDEIERVSLIIHKAMNRSHLILECLNGYMN